MRRVEAYMEYLVSHSLSYQTIRVYTGLMARAIEWFDERGWDLTEPRPIHVAEYAATTKASHSTRGQLRAALRHYWDSLGVDQPPLGAVRVPPQPRMVCRALEPDEAQAMVEAALGWYPAGTAVLFGLYLALRRTEIAAARWDRFDPDLSWYTVTGKGDVTATIPVHPVLRNELDPDGEWVFPGRPGVRDHASPNTIWQWTKEVAEAAGLDPVTTHRLRHTSLATANDNLGDLRAVQTFARHANPETTAGYTRTTSDRLRQVSDSLDFY